MKVLSLTWSPSGLQIKTRRSIYTFESKHILRISMIAFTLTISALWSFDMINISDSPLIPSGRELHASQMVMEKKEEPVKVSHSKAVQPNYNLKSAPPINVSPQKTTLTKGQRGQSLCPNKTLILQKFGYEEIQNFRQLAKTLVDGRIGPITKSRIKELHRLCRVRYYSAR